MERKAVLIILGVWGTLLLFAAFGLLFLHPQLGEVVKPLNMEALGILIATFGTIAGFFVGLLSKKPE